MIIIIELKKKKDKQNIEGCKTNNKSKTAKLNPRLSQISIKLIANIALHPKLTSKTVKL